MTEDGDLPVELRDKLADRPPLGGLLGVFASSIDCLNHAMLVIGMIALVVAAFILTYSVFSRYLFKAATDWQDEAAVFCIVGAVFLWWGLVRLFKVPGYILPTPGDMLVALYRGIASTV